VNKRNKRKTHLLYTVCGTKKDALKLGKILISENKAVCINILDKMLSIYEENERIIKSKECILLIKTLLKSKEVIKFISQNHKYKIPFIADIKIKKINSEYLKWAESKTFNRK
tara:strand:+ start:61 stop:399 length:339 start_codon:yes stop_codon:yes gene_type:complete